ncbi:hypothetical protein H1D32_05325 [Anaerobacillus sp. CMMVII]|uniref:ATP-binding protein n=1 Tax=Anaerobacillus sp. CMMVII TaxID=2755588 RepID=UPI0021B7CEF2|nr:sensor histidine kinase [Anaerobacillus sp. CMMVII]MCT8137211.1 hypothetical protein [Anaerobacillus sp. CMMVII]
MYYIFLLNPSMEKKYRELFISLLSLVAMILCMVFPYYDANGTIYDLRIIPFLLGGLYGGRKVALTLFIGLVLTRFFIGYNLGFYVTFIQALITLAFVYYFSSIFHQSKFSKKIVVSLGFIFVIWGLNVIIYWMIHTNDLQEKELMLTSLVNHILVTVLTFVLVLYIIEYILQMLRFKKEISGAEKLRVVSQLAASVSHEVRNPLTVTRGFLQLLKDDSIDDQKRKEYLDLSLQELDRAQTIITDYLTYAKPSDENKPENLTIATEIAYLVQVMTPYALMQGVEILISNISGGFVIGDRQKFRQSLINIVKNGIEAMPNGGILEIGTSNINKDIVISIKDTGIGMSQEQIQKIGTPFLTTKKTGTGLGTMVAYNLIREMGGKVKVKSRRGTGTEFVLVFPNVK